MIKRHLITVLLPELTEEKSTVPTAAAPKAVVRNSIVATAHPSLTTIFGVDEEGEPFDAHTTAGSSFGAPAVAIEDDAIVDNNAARSRSIGSTAHRRPTWESVMAALKVLHLQGMITGKPIVTKAETFADDDDDDNNDGPKNRGIDVTDGDGDGSDDGTGGGSSADASSSSSAVGGLRLVPAHSIVFVCDARFTGEIVEALLRLGVGSAYGFGSVSVAPLDYHMSHITRRASKEAAARAAETAMVR